MTNMEYLFAGYIWLSAVIYVFLIIKYENSEKECDRLTVENNYIKVELIDARNRQYDYEESISNMSYNLETTKQEVISLKYALNKSLAATAREANRINSSVYLNTDTAEIIDGSKL